MPRFEFVCQRYPQLQVGPRSAGLRFTGGRFATDDEAQAAALQRLPASYGVDLVSAPTDPPGTAGEDAGGSGAGECPARSARKTDWVRYAQQVDPDADLDGWTKDELIDRYGGDG
ncbi:MAG TPA: hypothetical protein VFH77_14175 [Streptomyces sp.]|nr:hypothetical protein [Streptomyces sp.]